MNGIVEIVPIDALGLKLGIREACSFPEKWRRLPLTQWVMDADDHVLRYVFRNIRPTRHLEFGTWLGDGVLRCVEECDATVWTVNALDGETLADGSWAYATRASEVPAGACDWSESLTTDADKWVRTDAYGMIGRKYLNAGWGRRVCQIYADSRQWDAHAYPAGFFDTVFVDGGHAYDIIANDTRLATDLVKDGGLVIWHDFCPLAEVTSGCSSTRDVVGFVSANLEPLALAFETLFWVQPSWLLFGVRRRADSRKS